MTPDADPGWREALRYVALMFAIVGMSRFSRDRDELPGLVVMRTGHLSLAVIPLLYVIAFSSITDWDGGDEGVAPPLIVAVGATSLLIASLNSRKELDSTTRASLAGSFRARMFVGIAIVEFPALFSIACLFVIQNSLWLQILGTLFTLAGLWLIAPSRRNLARDQTWLREQGSSLDIVQALNLSSGGPRLDVPE